MRKGEIACYKQFLLFSQFFLHLYIFLVCQNAALCGNGLNDLQEVSVQGYEKQCLDLEFLPFPTMFLAFFRDKSHQLSPIISDALVNPLPDNKF